MKVILVIIYLHSGYGYTLTAKTEMIKFESMNNCQLVRSHIINEGEIDKYKMIKINCLKLKDIETGAIEK